MRPQRREPGLRAPRADLGRAREPHPREPRRALCGPAKEERAFGEAIAEQAHTTVNNLIGKSSLKQLQAVLGAAHVVIAPDTGPAHMAAATGVPVIGLYASSNPQRTGPYSSLKWTVDKYPQALKQFNQQDVASAAWGKRVRAADVMDIIEVNDVTAMLDKVMHDNPIG